MHDVAIREHSYHTQSRKLSRRSVRASRRTADPEYVGHTAAMLMKTVGDPLAFCLPLESSQDGHLLFYLIHVELFQYHTVWEFQWIDATSVKNETQSPRSVWWG